MSTGPVSSGLWCLIYRDPAGLDPGPAGGDKGEAADLSLAVEGKKLGLKHYRLFEVSYTHTHTHKFAYIQVCKKLSLKHHRLFECSPLTAAASLFGLRRSRLFDL